jgi:hypothetical protein
MEANRAHVVEGLAAAFALRRPMVRFREPAAVMSAIMPR